MTSAVKIADAIVFRIVVTATEVSFYAKDWQEEDVVIVFADPLFLEDHGLVGEDLSHLTIVADSDAVKSACRRTEDDPSNYSSMLVYGAWSDEPLFHIVASSVRMHSGRPVPAP